MLVDVAIALVGESGPHGFSVAEASRRAGVSVAAPYRHFPTREALLVAVGVRGYDAVAEAFAQAVAGSAKPAEQLAAAATAYVRWTETNPAMFDVLFGAGIDKKQYPDLSAAADRAFRALLAPALEVSGDDQDLALEIATAVGVIAHGYATLLRDGHTAAQASGARAAAAVRALTRGRALLRP